MRKGVRGESRRAEMRARGLVFLVQAMWDTEAGQAQSFVFLDPVWLNAIVHYGSCLWRSNPARP